jgi:MFS family permease
MNPVSTALPESLPSLQLTAPIIGAIVGVIILLFGRRIFWLCVAAVGFAAGVEMAPHIVQQPSPLLALTFALVLGFVGALLALFLQKIAVAIAGFVSGGKLALAVAAAFLGNAAQFYWLTFIIGGVIGAILLLSLFDWALIFVSSILGAYLIQGLVTLPPTGTTILFMVLVVVGVLVQAGAFRRSRVVVAE